MNSVKTAKLLILAAAGLSFLFSVYLWFAVDIGAGRFRGPMGSIDFVIWRPDYQRWRTASWMNGLFSW